MSSDLPPGAARAFYGDPQHETRPPTDAERVRVVTPPPPLTDRELYRYADSTDPDGGYSDADAFRRPVAEPRTAAEILASRRLERALSRDDGDGDALVVNDDVGGASEYRSLDGSGAVVAHHHVVEVTFTYQAEYLPTDSVARNDV